MTRVMLLIDPFLADTPAGHAIAAAAVDRAGVPPAEIEDVAMLHPGVKDAGAVGVPDERSGEAVKLFIVKKDPALTEQQVREFCHDNLTGYKRPSFIEFRTELPKTPVGKILRRELRDKRA